VIKETWQKTGVNVRDRAPANTMMTVIKMTITTTTKILLTYLLTYIPMLDYAMLTCLKRFSCITRTSGTEDRLSDLVVPVCRQRQVGQNHRSLPTNCKHHRQHIHTTLDRSQTSRIYSQHSIDLDVQKFSL